MRCGESAETEQGKTHRNVGLLSEGPHFLHRARQNDAVPSEYDRPLGIVDQFQRLLVFAGCWRQVGTVSQELRRNRLAIKLASGLLRILGDVHQDWPRASGFGDIESLADGLRDLTCVRDEVIVLRNGK